MSVSIRFLPRRPGRHSVIIAGFAVSLATLLLGAPKVAALPDLVVQDIRALRVEGDQELRQFGATIKNVGDTPTPEGVVHGVSFWVADGREFGDDPEDYEAVNWTDTWTESLEPGESVELVADGGPDGSRYWRVPEFGEYSLMAWVDDVDRIEEADDTNNRHTRLAYLAPVDVRPAHVQISYAEREGDPVTISAILENLDSHPPEEATAVFTVNGERVGEAEIEFRLFRTTGIPSSWVELESDQDWIAEPGEHIFGVTIESSGETLEQSYVVLPDQGLPDLVIRAVGPQWGEENEKIEPYAEITNQGDAPTPEGVVHRVDFYVDDERLAWSTGHTSSIAPGETVTLHADGGPVGEDGWYARPGSMHWEVVVDPENRIHEAYQVNNRRFAIQIVNSLRSTRPWMLQEFTLIDLEWSPSAPQPGDEVTFTATVDAKMETEDTPASVLDVAFFVNGERVAMAEPADGTLGPATRTLTMTAETTWTATEGVHEVYAYADPKNEVPEYRLWDNTLGKDLVVANGNGYAAWQEEQFSEDERADPEISGPDATGPDGVANLIKFALGLDRHDSVHEAISIEGNAEGWSYTYRRATDREELDFRVEASTDLNDWSTDGIVHEQVSAADGFETWRAFPATDFDRLFFRLVVESR